MSDFITREELVEILDDIATNARRDGADDTDDDIIADAALRIANKLRPDYSDTGISNSDIDNQNANVVGTVHERTLDLSEDWTPGLSSLPTVDADSSLQNAFVQDWLQAWARAHTVYGSDEWMAAARARSEELANTPFARTPEALIEDASRFEGILEHIQGTYDYTRHEAEAASPSPTGGRPTVTLSNDEVLAILAGTTMGVRAVDGTEYNVRMATADELEVQMRAAAESAGVDPPAEGYRPHAERLSQTVDLEAALKGRL